MSRIGRRPIPLPGGVEVEVRERIVAVRGPKGRLELALPERTRARLEDGRLRVERDGDDRRARAMHGLARALLANVVRGVTEGFSRTLEIVGVGYRARLEGGKLVLSVGYSHPVEVGIPDGIEVTLESPTRIVVRGIDKQRVGQFAAEIRRVRPPEPYKGKGIRYADEVVRRKAGKAGAGG